LLLNEFFPFQNIPKSISAAASPQTQLVELTALLRPPAVSRGPLHGRRGMEGSGGKD